MSDAGAELIICEGKPRWAVALRLHDTGLPLRHCTTLDQCDRRLAARPASLVAVEVTEKNLSSVLRWLAQLDTRWPRAAAIGLVQPALLDCEAALYEAGTAWVSVSLVEVDHVARLATRHLAKHRPPSGQNLLEQIRARLPWPDAANTTQNF